MRQVLSVVQHLQLSPSSAGRAWHASGMMSISIFLAELVCFGLQGLVVTAQQGTSQVLPVVRELQEGLAGQLERVKELAVALQDVERGKLASMSQLLQQVSDRRAMRPGHADNERLRQEVCCPTLLVLLLKTMAASPP